MVNFVNDPMDYGFSAHHPQANLHHNQLLQMQQQHYLNPFSRIFNNNDYLQVPETGDIIDQTSLLFTLNYVTLTRLSPDTSFNDLYFCNPNYVWTLFNSLRKPGGEWLNNVYISYDNDAALVLTTPTVTLRVNKNNSTYLIVNNERRAMTDEEVKEGLIPILETIELIYTKDEEAKRTAELNRLKELEESQPTNKRAPAKNKFINLKTSKVKNRKSSFTAFYKEVDKVTNNADAVKLLTDSCNRWASVIRCYIPSNDKVLECSDKDGNDVVFSQDLDGTTTITVGSLELILPYSNVDINTPAKVFEYTDLKNPEIIKQTAHICDAFYDLLP